jgi:CubicO group peptidase (beta-lactamase class C family)
MIRVERFRRWMPAIIVCLFTVLPVPAQKNVLLEQGSPASAGMDGAKIEQGVKLYRDAVDRDDIRGAVLMVARHGRIILLEAIGWKHRGYRLPMEKDTLFRMASNTKPVIATAILMLEEQGKLLVDDAAGKHLESFKSWRSHTVTIAHLLSHSSGLRINTIFYPFEAKDGPPSLGAAVAKFGAEGPMFEPGTTYSYSNPGYNTLGAIIEAAAGMPLEDFLKSRIYDPLGMADTLNHEDPAKLERMATVYRGRVGNQGRVDFQQGFTPDDPPDYPVIRASGGMISTAMDYARFLQMYLNGGRYGQARILSPESVRKATTPKIRINERSQYGFGWMISEDGIFSHSGSDGTMAWVDPANDLLGMVLTQSPGGRNPTQAFQKLITESCISR